MGHRPWWRGTPFLLAASASALAPIGLPAVPPWPWAICSAVLFLAILITVVWRSWAPLLLLLPAVLTLSQLHLRVTDRLLPELAGRTLDVTGTVTGLPGSRGDWLEFLLIPDRETHREPRLPGLIRVRWYQNAPSVTTGERWRLPLRLQPPRGRVNFNGGDPERRYFADRIGALATVDTTATALPLASAGPGLDRWRQDARQKIVGLLGDEPATGLVLALAIADRSALSDEQWSLLAVTGTGHLLAISGLHVGLAALLGSRLAWLAALLIPPACRERMGLVPAHVGALLTASGYAALAGFGVSTQRALIMLGVWLIYSGRRRSPGHFQPWAMALLLVLLLDPLTALQAGFWLSFLAVAILLSMFSPRSSAPRGLIGAGATAQAAISFAMLPAGLLWFQRVALLGLVANSFAIPAVSLVIVPMVLLGAFFLVLGLDGPAAGFLLPASWSLSGLVRALETLRSVLGWLSFGASSPGPLAAVLATAGALLVLLPRELRLRGSAVCLYLMVLLRVDDRPAQDAMRIDLLDVGQGLSLLVSTHRELLVYDTGPGLPGAWDLHESVLQPAIRRSGHSAPSRIIVSHGDLDHAGGLASVQRAYPAATILANARNRTIAQHPCTTDTYWRDGPSDFTVLHPGPWLPYLGNLSSCVLSLGAPGHSALLPGDIEHVIEDRLVAEGLGPHEVLIAPHHGSRTSAGAGFVSAVSPKWVLIPAGAGNRFDFPHPEPLLRFRRAGARVASVSDCGALRAEWSADGTLSVTSARRARPAPWRWPAAEDCP